MEAKDKEELKFDDFYEDDLKQDDLENDDGVADIMTVFIEDT